MKPNLDGIRVASSCPAAWEQMTGDNRVRFCSLCNLNVYNFAELTRREAEDLIRKTEGRLCGRLYRRSDGSVITKDCPIGLRAVRRRVARIAGAAFAAIMFLCSVVMGQKQSAKDQGCRQQVKITSKIEQGFTDAAGIAGTVIDPNGAVVAGAKIQIVNRQSNKTYSLTANDEGRFSKSGLPAGTYDILIDSPGFKQLKMVELKLASGQTDTLEATLLVNAEMLTGVIAITPAQLIDTVTIPGGTVISGDLIRRLPF